MLLILHKCSGLILPKVLNNSLYFASVFRARDQFAAFLRSLSMPSSAKIRQIFRQVDLSVCLPFLESITGSINITVTMYHLHIIWFYFIFTSFSLLSFSELYWLFHSVMFFSLFLAFIGRIFFSCCWWFSLRSNSFSLCLSAILIVFPGFHLWLLHVIYFDPFPDHTGKYSTLCILAHFSLLLCSWCSIWAVAMALEICNTISWDYGAFTESWAIQPFCHLLSTHIYPKLSTVQTHSTAMFSLV